MRSATFSIRSSVRSMSRSSLEPRARRAAAPRTVALASLCAASSLAFAADGTRVAIFPPLDRAGRSAPVEQIQSALESALSIRGFAPLPRADLDEFFRRHRVRYTGGISAETARAIG